MNEYRGTAGAPQPADADVAFAETAPEGRRAELLQRLQQGAEYLRNLEPDDLRNEIEESIRLRPLLSVALAATAGFLLGRLLRR